MHVYTRCPTTVVPEEGPSIWTAAPFGGQELLVVFPCFCFYRMTVNACVARQRFSI